MGEAKRKQQSATAAIRDGQLLPLTPRATNRLHDAFCRWQGAVEHANTAQLAWTRALLDVCDALGIQVPQHNGQLDLGRVQVNFLEGTIGLGADPATMDISGGKGADG